MSQGTATSTFTVGIKYDTETLSQLESQLERIAELLDRIDGRREVGTKQAEYKDAATIINEVEQAYHAQGVFSGKLRSLVSKAGKPPKNRSTPSFPLWIKAGSGWIPNSVMRQPDTEMSKPLCQEIQVNFPVYGVTNG